MLYLRAMFLLLLLTKVSISAEAEKQNAVAPALWKKLDRTVLKSGEIDSLIEKELARLGITPAPLCSDYDYIRRVSLDLTGKPPSPLEIRLFLSDKSSDKRKKYAEKLIESDNYAKHWATYWAEVIAAKITDRRGMIAYRPFEEWMTEQIKLNRGWDKIAHDLVCAEGQVAPGEKGDGRTFLMLAHLGPDAPVERAAEVSRIFLGMQIQCAQCHDHPSDIWKREQFHEFAAYFARTGDRLVPLGDMKFGLRVFGKFFGEHKMPSKEDPEKGTNIQPKFLDGREGPKFANDQKRREALSIVMVENENPWFAASYVNRIWAKLLGQGFYQPIDDIGPQKEAVHHEALLRLVGAFQGSNYDTREFLRSVVHSNAYQREARLGKTQDEHLLFAAVYPSRLSAESLWENLSETMEGVGGPFARFVKVNPLFFARSYEGQFKSQFKFDPSAKPDEVEGAVAQALWFMNNPQIEDKIKVKGNNVLVKLLKENPQDDLALKALYLKTLAREPSFTEQSKCMQYIRNAFNRETAYEDLLWALINTTEFQSRR